MLIRLQNLLLPGSALLDDDTVEGWVALLEACVVTCADGYTAAGDTEITMTCIFDLELTSMLLEGSTHSCQQASGDLSTLIPPSTANHDCPKTVFGKSWIVDCSSCPVAISGTAALTVLAGGSDGSLTKARYFTCEALTCSIGDHLLDNSLCGSWTRGEGCVVTFRTRAVVGPLAKRVMKLVGVSQRLSHKLSIRLVRRSDTGQSRREFELRRRLHQRRAHGVLH